MVIEPALMLRLLDGDRDFTTIRGNDRNIDIRFEPPPPRVTLTVEQRATSVLQVLGGALIKIDHKNNQPTLNGASSFIELPNAQALSQALEFPPNESSVDQNLANLIGGLSGGFYVIDRVRTLVNNLHARIDASTLRVTLEPGAILVDISFTSNNPALEMQARAYLGWFFGIPVGWVDSSFPDVHLTDIHVLAD